MNSDQIKRAIIAKTKDKSNMPSWYYPRLGKCIGCEFNSGNVDKISFKDRIRIAHNFGKDACLKCTCGVEDKASDPAESCPEGFWEEEKKIRERLDIVSKTDKASIVFNNTAMKYKVDYGVIPYQFDSTITLFIKDKNIKNITVNSSCGCTTANPTKTEEGTSITIKYDTLRVGSFDKNITISYLRDNRQNKTIVNIIGIVLNKKM